MLKLIMKLKKNSPISMPVLFISLSILAAVFYLNRNPAVVSESLPGFQVDTFSGDIQVFSASQNSWTQVERGFLLMPGDRLKTGAGAQIEFQIADSIRGRLREDSEILFPKNRTAKDHEPAFRIELKKGTCFLASDSEALPHPLEIALGPMIAITQEAFTLAASQESLDQGSLGILRGSAALEDYKNRPLGTLHSMQKLGFKNSKPFAEPEAMDQRAWQQYHEAYELIEHTAASEAAQLDLSKKAGNLFVYVFDHGTFFTPKMGYANREFTTDPLAGEVYLQIEYDVFPVGSFVGMYLKTRGLDLSKYAALRFQMRRNPKEAGFPEAVKIEVKSPSGTLQSFMLKHPERDWTPVEFPLRFSKPAEIREIALVFMNERIGGYSKGFIQLKNFMLVPKENSPVQTPDTSPREQHPSEDDLLAQLLQ